MGFVLLLSSFLFLSLPSQLNGVVKEDTFVSSNLLPHSFPLPPPPPPSLLLFYDQSCCLRVGLFCTALIRTAQCIIASMVLFCTACPRTAAMPMPVRNRTKGAIPHWAQCACPTITKTFIHPFLPQFVADTCARDLRHFQLGR